MNRIAELTAVALGVAPELSAKPFYLLPLPSWYAAPEGCRAFTSLTTDHRIRQHLVDRGEWRGPGTTILLADASNDFETACGVTLHEVAHNLPFVSPAADVEPTAEEIARETELIARWATLPPVSALLPWDWAHGKPFIRTCLHLAHRSGLPLPALGFAGPSYGLSGAWKYRRALGDEPERLRRATFAEIAATPAPAAFAKLWEADISIWEQTRSKKNAN